MPDRPEFGEVCYFLFFWRGVLFIDRPVCSYIMYKDVLLLLSSNNLCFPYFPIRRMGIPLVINVFNITGKPEKVEFG